MKLDPLENGGVEEEEGFPVVCAFISAHGFTLRARLNGHLCVALPPKHAKQVSGLILPMLHHILTGGESGGLSKEVLRGPRAEGSVIYFGRRVRGCFHSIHLEES